jgi:hypothetical protein
MMDMKLLASRNRRSKDVRILSIVVAELKFRDIQRHVFGTHLVECAHHTALEDRPKALNRLCVNRTDDVLALGVVAAAITAELVRSSERRSSAAASGDNSGHDSSDRSSGRQGQLLRRKRNRDGFNLGRQKIYPAWEFPCRRCCARSTSRSGRSGTSHRLTRALTTSAPSCPAAGLPS